MTGDPTVTVEGVPIAVNGMPVSPHTYMHYGAVTTATQATVFCNGQPIIATGDPDSCGDVRVGGSTSVFVG